MMLMGMLIGMFRLSSDSVGQLILNIIEGHNTAQQLHQVTRLTFV